MEFLLLNNIQNLTTLNQGLVIFLVVFGKALGSIFFIPTAALTVFSGTFFGISIGAFISIVGNILGALISFFISRLFLYNKVRKILIPKYLSLLEYEEKISKNGFLTVFLLRLFPFFPFSVENYILGTMKISTGDYIVGTIAGLVPGTLLFTYFGNSLRMFNFLDIALSTIFLIIFLYGGLLTKKVMKKAKFA